MRLADADMLQCRDEGHTEWRVALGSKGSFLRSLGVVAGEEKSSRWEERKEKLRRAVGGAKLQAKRSFGRLRETLLGKKGE